MRLKVVQFLYLLALAAVAVRLFYWQVVRADELAAKAERQHTNVKAILPPRGQIYFSDLAPLASNKPSYLLYGLPKAVKDRELLANQVANVLEPDPNSKAALMQEVRLKLSQDLYWVPLLKNIDHATKVKIEGLQNPGLGFESQLARFYPEGSSSAHLLGFVGEDEHGRQTGYFGVEGFYNGELRGVAGEITEERDAKGLPILIGKFFKKEVKRGNGLILHLDRTVQHMVEQKLKEGVEKYGAKAGSAVVMEPKSGSILAMASYPNYDPAAFGDFPREYFKNPVVADSYEPGSTFKTLVMAAAINEDLVEPDTKCDICDGPVKVGGFSIRTWNNKYYPDTTMTETLVHSDNTGMVFIGRKLGVDKLYEYIEKFGFGNLTKIDLQDEATPDIRPKQNWREVDLATASFGQGIAVSMIQMVRAVASIANGGLLMEPHVVKSIVMEDKAVEIKPKVAGNPISAEAAKMVTAMMVEAVEKGEARVFKPKGFSVAGKTGTAQIPIAGHYDQNKTIASFVGFAPSQDPKFVMLVRYSEPTSSVFGSETAAPTFFAVARELFTYYNIAPSE